MKRSIFAILTKKIFASLYRLQPKIISFLSRIDAKKGSESNPTQATASKLDKRPIGNKKTKIMKSNRGIAEKIALKVLENANENNHESNAEQAHSRMATCLEEMMVLIKESPTRSMLSIITAEEKCRISSKIDGCGNGEVEGARSQLRLSKCAAQSFPSKYCNGWSWHNRNGTWFHSFIRIS
ncbi:MAG: hypothetical protein ACREBR_00925 [bacterium]